MNEQTKKPAGSPLPPRPNQGDRELEKGQEEQRRDEELQEGLEEEQQDDEELPR